MKKIVLFTVALAIGFASFAQTAPAKKETKSPAQTEKKSAKKAEVKKTDSKKAVKK